VHARGSENSLKGASIVGHFNVSRDR